MGAMHRSSSRMMSEPGGLLRVGRVRRAPRGSGEQLRSFRSTRHRCGPAHRVRDLRGGLRCRAAPRPSPRPWSIGAGAIETARPSWPLDLRAAPRLLQVDGAPTRVVSRRVRARSRCWRSFVLADSFTLTRTSGVSGGVAVRPPPSCALGSGYRSDVQRSCRTPRPSRGRAERSNSADSARSRSKAATSSRSTASRSTSGIAARARTKPAASRAAARPAHARNTNALEPHCGQPERNRELGGRRRNGQGRREQGQRPGRRRRRDRGRDRRRDRAEGLIRAGRRSWAIPVPRLSNVDIQSVAKSVGKATLSSFGRDLEERLEGHRARRRPSRAHRERWSTANRTTMERDTPWASGLSRSTMAGTQAPIKTEGCSPR